MSEITLPLKRFSADTYLHALENLVDRYYETNEPVHYKKAAIGISETTGSSCLKYFSEIDLIDAEKAGVYTPSKPVVEYFKKSDANETSARIELDEYLKDYEVYSEAKFLASRDEFDIDTLSGEIVGQLPIEEEEKDKVRKAIEIFSSFGLFKEDEDVISVASLNRDEVASTNVEKSGESESRVTTQSSEIPSEIDLPPTSGDPEKLVEVVEELSSGGTHTPDELDAALSFSSRSIQRELRYGSELGFVKESEEGYILTERGFELAFSTERAEREELFYSGIADSRSYRSIIASLLEGLKKDESNEISIDLPSVLKELRTTYSFTDSKDSTLKSAINAFLQTIEAAGIGEYIIGSGSNPTRLEISQSELKRIEGLVVVTEPKPSAEVNEPDDASSKEEHPNHQSESPESKSSEIESPESDSSETSSVRGPALRISKVRIQNFRNIRDTRFFDLENVTTLIGKNESGKTSTLEAIASFDKNYEYTDRDLPDSTTLSGLDGKVPIITLEFKVSASLAIEFYPDIPGEVDYPVTVTRTKYSDGSYEADIDAPLEDIDIELPSPDILYYDSYSLISDKATIDDIESGEEETFSNLLKIGELDLDDLGQQNITHFNAIEQAENNIERELNAAWSQKNLNIKIEWEGDTETIHLLIQDEFDSESLDDERALTYPSQRSEGFQWFFSFYINLLAESHEEGNESKVLLLDDPAVYLHPEGKQDWLASVDKIGKEEQVVFTSHSPYLIDKRYPSRIRTVEDTPGGGTKIRQDIFESDKRTLEPLRNALGINLGSSPFVSRRQILVEGPTEYYAISAVANYFTEVLDRDLFGWQKVSIMPVRGASDVVGKASWLAGEEIDYAILLDSDKEGRNVRERISQHHSDIEDDRVVLLQNQSNIEDVVTEDLFEPELYVPEFNREYEEYTSELEDEFEPATVESLDEMSWKIGAIEYDGQRLDEVLEEYLERQDVAEQLENSKGEIELRKRQIAERIASRLNHSTIDQSHLDAFNRLFSEIDAAIDSGDQ